MTKYKALRLKCLIILITASNAVLITNNEKKTFFAPLKIESRNPFFLEWCVIVIAP